ncbi:GMC family oxidoreductase [Algoriphagus halophytocola]|uniref:GMC family oxidoreductase n=1 Tax=Algoriphagus halophytocola TaxID=2991499 RepID=A0ABY6MG21_9BACT|nr:MULTISPECIES: GMC family oxidoreductase [unclassified Algoriphagus]UZD22760.1 GMC family oxidoreductase [Algoriphagus sp. TR-M5]WBL44025.1 GMC family oxidoreductase [Algoriphagus sp. TR-M9]
MLQDSKEKRTYDAIVIGSGASGGWAAKELTEKGLKTLVLERGRMVKHIEDYPTASKAPWEFEFRGAVPLEKRSGLGGGRWLRAETAHWALADDEQPIIQEKPFRWFRGYHVGGKSLLWARATQRWSDFDYEGPVRDGFAVDWPIRYKDLEPWYTHVEKFAGIAGNKDGLAELPDSEVMPGFEMSCIENYYKEQLASNFENRYLIQGRCAHLTDPQEIHKQQGRNKCQHQAMCNRGCVYGGYFSANASTLPWAEKTGNLTVRPDAVVESIIYDDAKGKATGVRIIDRNTKEAIEFYAKIIFVNASTIASNAILLNSKSSTFSGGIGNENGLMGKYLACHNYRGKGSASFEGFLDKFNDGRNPGHAYVPRFRNVFKQETDFLRGYSIGMSGGRGQGSDTSMIGDQLRDNLLNQKYGVWHMSAWMQGETVPVEDNHVRLSTDQVDKYGIPQIILSVEWKENDDKMVADFVEQQTLMYEKAGFTNIKVEDSHSDPGSDIHEMGGVRMGHDPKTSLLNKYNQLHHCKNVFVTDGACMTSTSTQNPTLTFMALTARAANYAVEELNRQNL